MSDSAAANDQERVRPVSPADGGSPIRRLRRLEETTFSLPMEGDNWHTTWAADGCQYTLQCDGQGYNSRLWRLVGDPPEVRFEWLAGYPDLLSEEKPRVNRYYGFGIVACGGALYHFLSTPNHCFDEPGARFVGAKLIWSPDEGDTWLNQEGGPVAWEEWEQRGRHNMVFFREPDDCFSLLSVLQMGQGYELNRDGYLYVYSPNGSVEGTMNQLVLFRAPTNRLRDRGAYEFYAGDSGEGGAAWSPDLRDRSPVCAFSTGWVNQRAHPYSWHPCVVYNPGLETYLMACWGMGTDGDQWFTRPSYLGFWTAPQPWGPWTQVHEETAWLPGGDPAARAYQPQIPPRWIAPDGRSFWLVWTDFRFPGPYYQFNAQQVIVE